MIQAYPLHSDVWNALTGQIERILFVVGMALRLASSAGASRRSQPSSDISRLQNIASSAQQQALSGEDRELTSLQLTAVERITKELANDGPDHSPSAPKNILWNQAPQDVAAYLALYSSALRRSSPFASGDDTQSAYANIRKSLCKQLRMMQDRAGGPHCELLGAALLRTDTLQCYSRLMAAASEQLQPAAAALLTSQPDPHAHPQASDSLPVPAAAERGQRRPEPGDQLRGPKHRQPHVRQLGSLLLELIDILNHLCNAMPHSNTSGSDSACAPAAAAATSSTGSAGQPCAPNSHMVPELRAQLQYTWVLEHWARLLLLGTTLALACADGSQPEQERDVQAVQALVLESLCRVHNSTQLHWSDFLRRPCGCTLAATHMAHLCAALDAGHAFGLRVPESFALRPLDWQDAAAFVVRANEDAIESDVGMCERGRLMSLLPVLHTLRAWATLLGEALQKAQGSGAAAKQQAEKGPPSGCAEVNRLEQDTIVIDGASAERLTPPGPGRAGTEAGGSALVPGGGGGPSEGPGADCGGAVGSTDGKATAGAEAAGEDLAERAAGPGRLSSLPPFNRAATFAVCLRLARIAARWDAGCGRASGAATAGPLLPKVGGCVALHYALECARLALLPDVWGRERVPRRTRVQLREWWDTYVAAAQHPEALLVAVPERLDYPEWTREFTGGLTRGMGPTVCSGASCRVGPGILAFISCTHFVTPVIAVRSATDALFRDAARSCPSGFHYRPSADASAALAAGLLPCMTRLVTRMGAGRDRGGALWCPPNNFPGANYCLAEVALFGPLEQVGELLSALSRRLRLAVGELQLAAAGRRGSGRSVAVLGGAVHEALRVVTYLFHLPLAAGVHRLATACGTGTDGEAAVAAGFAERLGMRLSVVAAELLPAVSRAVQGCAELMGNLAAVRHEGRRDGGGDPDQGASLSGVVRRVTNTCYAPAATALGYVVMLLVKQTDERAACQPLVSRADGGCGGGGGTGGGDGPWRQLLLREGQLMELLGACLELSWQAEEAAGVQGVSPGDKAALTTLRESLVRALPPAAAAFPGQFRAAVSGIDAGAAAAAAAVRAGAQAGGTGAAGGAGRCAGNRDTPPCISLSHLRELLLGAAEGEEGGSWELGVVDDVLGGWEPTMEDVEELVCAAWESCWGEPEHTWRVFDVMLTPGEARAAVAAAAAAAAGAAAEAAPVADSG